MTNPPSPRTVCLQDEQGMAVDTQRIRSIALATAAAEGAVGEMGITLVEPESIAELNAEHLGGSGATDVLSFPVDGLVTLTPGPHDPPVLIGDIVLCPAVAAAQAPPGPDGTAAELDLLTAHGVLHLLGYDHDTEEAAAAMRAREKAVSGRSGARAS